MKLSKIFGMLACAGLIGFSSNVFALGEADGQFLKLSFKSVNGFAFNPMTLEIIKGSTKGTCYTLLSYQSSPPTGVYSATQMLCLDQASKQPIPAAILMTLTESSDGKLAFSTTSQGTFLSAVSSGINAAFNATLMVKADSKGNFKTASIKSSGCSILNGAVGGNPFTGGCEITGAWVKESAVPMPVASMLKTSRLDDSTAKPFDFKTVPAGSPFDSNQE